ncbi:hypothetical protein ACFX2K_025637 [Malus domestica]
MATNNSVNGQIPENEHECNPNPLLEQLIPPLHDGEPIDRLKHGDHMGQVPKRSDVDMNDLKEEECDNAEKVQQN